MIFKAKVCNASLAEINCFSERAIKDLLSAAKHTVFTMLLSQRISWIQKSRQQTPSQRWRRQWWWWWWNLGWFKTVNACLPDQLQTMKVEMIQKLEKFQTGIEPAWPLRRLDATLCPLGYWRAGHCEDHFRPLQGSFPLSCLYPKFKIEVISYISIHVSELRDVIRGN